MALLNDHRSRFRKGLSNPFTSIGLKWCRFCKMDVDHDTESRHQGTTYAYRTRCLRCGNIIDRGLFDNCVLVTGGFNPAAEAWTQERGVDRS